jgi:hypothetical protein
MAATRKSTRRKAGAKKPARGITKANVKRVARRAQSALEGAAHDAGLALRRTADKRMRTARKRESKMVEAKGPAKRAARRVGDGVTSALEAPANRSRPRGIGPGRVWAARKPSSSIGGEKPAAQKRAAKRSAARRRRLHDVPSMAYVAVKPRT